MNAEWSVLPLVLRLRLLRDGIFPAFKGVTLRGAFGIHFRQTVCATRSGTCEGCRLRETCAFPFVFDSPTGEEDESRLRGVRVHAPHPFALQAPADDRASVPAGTDWDFRFTLIGKARQLLSYFIHAFIRLQKAGLGAERVPFILESVIADLPAGEWQVYHEGATALRYPPEARGWPAPQAASRIEVRFQSLTRIKMDGRVLRQIPFEALGRAALRRLTALHSLYCGPLEERDNRCLLEQARAVRCIRSRLEAADVARKSTRTGQRMCFDGVMGMVEYEGPLSDWLPYLHAAEQVNVGKGASFGFGHMELSSA